MVSAAPEAARVPRRWPDSTIVCLATGPSLTPADVDYCRGKAVVLAVKDAIRLAPWADVLYGCGLDTGKWWPTHAAALASFAGLRFTLDPQAAHWATVLRYTGVAGLETDPGAVRTGINSGYQAINVAVHLGARRIILLGYDLQPGPKGEDHWFGRHPWRPQDGMIPLNDMRPKFATLVEPLRALGIEIVNATRRTALTCFPQVSLEEALP